MLDADVNWAARAAIAERAVVRRHLRPIAGVLPGTRLGSVRWPRRLAAPVHWHYWWQAHLLDCLIDAQLRDPRPRRASTIAMLTRSVRLRNGGRWTNPFYDDVAWLGLAVQRAGTLARSTHGPVLRAVTRQLHRGWTEDAGGGIWWRRGGGADGRVKNAPSNGPAAILMAREGQVEFAAAISDWMAETLVDPDTGLVRDGVRLRPDGAVDEIDKRIFTYCQGVYLGACTELAARDGHHRWGDRAVALVDAVTHRLARPDGVLPGCGGGDGGLFAGILARYLVVAALRLPALTDAAARLVLASADAAWRGRLEGRCGPVFSADWSRRAVTPHRGVPESDLSVQLSGWMVLEAAARLPR